MKQYLLLLKSSDFVKTGNIWTSNSINLYSNSQYRNYSYSRSQYGLNLIGDRTYTGTEVTSPAHGVPNATPFTSGALYVTDAGEVVRDTATPSLQRFIDTSSRVDLLSYKYTFTNVPGDYYPTISLTVFESDSSSGPWLQSSTSNNTDIIYIKNCKSFIKIQLTINNQNVDLNLLGLVFYLEVGIYEPTSPIISKHTKNILKRFPTWTSLYEDSFDSATPLLQIPESTGGKFLTAVMQENIDNFAADVDLNDINSYINSADEDLIAWLYVANNVPQNINIINGDSVQLARTSSFSDLIDGRVTDYSFFYNPMTRQLFTLRSFSSLIINGTLYSQTPINLFNQFDEFGARIGLPRLYLESNSNYKKRILDVNLNLPGVSLDAFKRTLRRELDLWRAWGTTPNSNYLGATPEVFEISDIELSTPYFDEKGNPQSSFNKLVEDLNIKYPTNMGYVRWENGYWDYSGTKGEGTSRIPAIYDTSTPLGSLYQPGVGDFDDALITLEPTKSATANFTGTIAISGFKATTTSKVWAPIVVDYYWYCTYLATVPDYDSSKVISSIVYEISMPPHANYATPTTFYVNLNYNNRTDFTVGNKYFSTDSSSPEYNYIKIFDTEGFSLPEFDFRDKIYAQRYNNTSRSFNKNGINIAQAASVNIIFNRIYDYFNKAYNTYPGANYRLSFAGTPNWKVNPAGGSSINMQYPYLNRFNANLLIGSNLYPTKNQSFNTDILTSSMVINAINSQSTFSVPAVKIYTADLLKNVIYPKNSATPQSLVIYPATPNNLTYYNSQTVVQDKGGRAVNPIDGVEYLIPSSPNMVFTQYNSIGGALSSTTFNHHVISLSSTPYYVGVSASGTTSSYPFNQQNYDTFDAVSTPSLYYGFVDENNNVYKDQTSYNNSFNQKDNYLTSIGLNKNTFGLSSSTSYIIDSISFNSTPDFISAYTLNKDSSINDLNVAFSNNTTSTIDVYADRDTVKENKYTVGINTGWIYLNEDEQYIYSNLQSATFNGRFSELTLPSAPRKNAPITAKVGSTDYRYLVFEDSATPGVTSFYNTETITSRGYNSLYLSYQNVSKISVTDAYTGKQWFSNLSTASNKISPFNAATPAIKGRDYDVVYYVNNAFYVDNDVYNSSIDDYQSKIYFSSTPSSNSYYYITYEQSNLNNYVDSQVSINQVDAPINQGFIYLTKDVYPFSKVDAHLSPAYISDSTSDIMYLTIISYDTQGNLKPNQTFNITSPYLTTSNAYVTTNNNGFAKVLLKYSGSVPATVSTSTITISGVTNGSVNAHANSATQGFSYSIPYEILRNINFDLKVKAAPMKLNISADGTTDVVIVGRVYWKDIPFPAAVNIGWNKSRTLYGLFNSSLSNTIQTGSDGSFQISETITAQSSATPGHWFARFEITDSASTILSYITANLGETPLISDIVITGDIVYWNEKYDNAKYGIDQYKLPITFTAAKENKSDLIATPSYTYTHYDISRGNYLVTTPNWTPPRWVSLRRFDQFEMNLLGATPNTISTYINVHPDTGEE